VPVPTSAASRKTTSSTERHAKSAVAGAGAGARPAKGAAASGRRTQGLRVDASPSGMVPPSFTRTVLKGLRPHPAAVERAAPAAGSTQRIVDAITTAIVERRLMPGTKLVEQQIADIFTVSRTLVRQALNQLSRDHLVTLEPARGAFVAQPSVEEAHQVFEVRKMLESSMVRQLCSGITDDQIAQLRQHVEDEADAVARTDVTGRTRLLADFHVVLARMLGNEVLAHLLADLLSRSQLISLMYQSSLSAAHSSEEHTVIVDALERRDAKAAARLMEHHLSNVSRNLQLHPRVSDLARVLKDA
jgi:DNA-binding GntR family transcriptional regulator